MIQRPKLLFLAYRFPPSRFSSCVRTWNVAKYLSRLGWEVTVVTPDPSFHSVLDDATTIDADLRNTGVRRILTGHRWRVLLQNNNGPLGSFATRVCRRAASYLGIHNSVGWIKAIDASCRNLTSENVDVVLATGPPYVAFRLAERLGHRLGRPYVLDYRDAWTADPLFRRPLQAEVKQERRLIKGASAVTVVSRSSASSLDVRFDVGSKLHVVTNGFDLEELEKVQPFAFEHFAIVYAGILFSPTRLITPLMAALQRLKKLTESDACMWKFHYYGPDGPHVRQEAERFAVVDRVVVHGSVTHEEAVSAVRGAGVTVVIHTTEDCSTPNNKGVIPGKLYESLGMGTPTLLISPPRSDAREIVKDSCNAQSFIGSDIEGIARFLQYRTRTKYMKARNSISSQFSWHVLAQKLDTVLRGVVDQPVVPASSNELVARDGNTCT